MDSATEDGIFHAREMTSDMSVEFWAIIGVGVGITAIFGSMFTFLNMRISDMRKDMRDIAKDLSETIALSEKRTNDRIDGLENNFREEFRQVNARIDGLDVRLRVVEQGQARVIGAVEMMQTIVVATLRGEQEEVGAD